MKQINLAAAFGLLLAFLALAFLVWKGEPATASRATAMMLAGAGALVAAMSGKLVSPIGQQPSQPAPPAPAAPSSPSPSSEPSRSQDGSWPPPDGP